MLMSFFFPTPCREGKNIKKKKSFRKENILWMSIFDDGEGFAFLHNNDGKGENIHVKFAGLPLND